jgi:hypothetical protein
MDRAPVACWRRRSRPAQARAYGPPTSGYLPATTRPALCSCKSCCPASSGSSTRRSHSKGGTARRTTRRPTGTARSSSTLSLTAAPRAASSPRGRAPSGSCTSCANRSSSSSLATGARARRVAPCARPQRRPTRSPPAPPRRARRRYHLHSSDTQLVSGVSPKILKALSTEAGLERNAAGTLGSTLPEIADALAAMRGDGRVLSIGLESFSDDFDATARRIHAFLTAGRPELASQISRDAFVRATRDAQSPRRNHVNSEPNREHARRIIAASHNTALWDRVRAYRSVFGYVEVCADIWRLRTDPVPADICFHARSTPALSPTTPPALRPQAPPPLQPPPSPRVPPPPKPLTTRSPRPHSSLLPGASPPPGAPLAPPSFEFARASSPPQSPESGSARGSSSAVPAQGRASQGRTRLVALALATLASLIGLGMLSKGVLQLQFRQLRLRGTRLRDEGGKGTELSQASERRTNNAALSSCAKRAANWLGRSKPGVMRLRMRWYTSVSKMSGTAASAVEAEGEVAINAPSRAGLGGRRQRVRRASTKLLSSKSHSDSKLRSARIFALWPRQTHPCSRSQRSSRAHIECSDVVSRESSTSLTLDLADLD